MLTAVQRGLILVGLLASALSAGFFYTYSISAMPGLTAADPQSAIRAMQGINSVIRTPTFAFAFFGALLFPAACAILAWLERNPRVAVFSALAAITYGIGVFAVTFLVNVPLNEALAQANATSETAARIWADYQQPWTAWNHVRAVCASLAFAFTAAASILHFSPGRR
jgi:uncharacterized membrane protein